MTIDIITYTDEQYAQMTNQQLEEVRKAQKSKDALARKLSENLYKEKYNLVEKGIFNSGLYQMIKQKLETEYAKQVELLREELLFYLKYSMSNEPITEAPYEVNYAHSFETRLTIVRQYYETTYPSATERFTAFKADGFAKGYLGECYSPLYTYFKQQAELDT